jgi:hypothetical protein
MVTVDGLGVTTHRLIREAGRGELTGQHFAIPELGTIGVKMNVKG